MPTVHGHKPGARKADHQTDNTNLIPQNPLASNETEATPQEREKKGKTNKICKLCGQFRRNPNFLWELEENSKNKPPGWVTKHKK